MGTLVSKLREWSAEGVAKRKLMLEQRAETAIKDALARCETAAHAGERHVVLMMADEVKGRVIEALAGEGLEVAAAPEFPDGIQSVRAGSSMFRVSW